MSPRSILARSVLLMAVATAALPTLPVYPAGRDHASQRDVVDEATIDALIEELGNHDFSRREDAANRLRAVGPAAVDRLLAAAELSTDLEIALRARWLVEGIPLALPTDSAEATALLKGFGEHPFAEQVRLMHLLLRLEDDAGIEPLARLVRLQRSPLGSRFAAAILIREWRPGDRYWRGMEDAIAAGIGQSQRPAAALLRSLLAFERAGHGGPEASTRETAVRETETVAERLAGDADRDGAAEQAVGGVEDEDSQEGESVQASVFATQQIFERCLLRMLVEAGQRQAAEGRLRRMIDGIVQAGGGAVDELDERISDLLIWAAENGLAGVIAQPVALVAERMAASPTVGYAAALCESRRGRFTEADALAARAFGNRANDDATRLRSALLLAKWGAADWAEREYRTLAAGIDQATLPHALAAILHAEFLHDQGRDAEATAALQPFVEDRERGHRLLQQLGRDPRTIRSRMHYFAACAAADRGDAIAQRKALDRSLDAYPRDVDTLIARYRLATAAAAEEADRTRALDQIASALKQLEQEIESTQQDANTYNEYAWLVSNTEGDVEKATRYSRHSLELAFDSASYLDTLAHCHAAAGRVEKAIRCQLLAKRYEPHNRTIQRNLERFQGMAVTSP